LIINCTPLGTFPNSSDYPSIPIDLLTKEHLVFDLIYNPEVTKLMELAKSQGATVLNGQKMLEYQAEKAWDIWNRD
jgi:shikimate dehydrogenase